MADPIRVSALYVHPVKSCAGLRVDEVTLDAMGVIGDRRFMLVDASGSFLTQRTDARLALVRVARSDGGGVVLTHAGRAALTVEVPSEGEREATVWGDRVRVRDCGDAAADWLSSLLGTPVRLVHMPDDSVREVDPKYAPAGARTSLADGFPLLLATNASLADLSRRAGRALEMERFRPNIVLSGGRAWDEDRWEELRVGATTLRLVKPCARCAITLVDPESGQSGAQPLRTLSAFRRGTDLGFRRVDAAHTYFAWNVLHEGTGTVRVGDAVTVSAQRLARPIAHRG